MFIITMTSKEYGTEEFVYDTEREVLKGYKRLKTRADKEFAKDNIKRIITLEKDRHETN